MVVSAVNLRKGGTLTILRQCLEHLSGVVATGKDEPGDLRVVALVHKRELCDYPGIEYIEMPWCIRSWFHRLWAEYVTMHGISRRLAREDGRKVWLWLSLHDTTPRVDALRREVYCHTSFPFLSTTFRDWRMDPKIPMFSIFTRFAYMINVRRNDSIIVQQAWFADALGEMLHLPQEKFRIIAPTMSHLPAAPKKEGKGRPYLFFYASTPDCHKNFETLCEAAAILDRQSDSGAFRVVLTIDGTENRYARWLYSRWGSVGSIDFHGFLSKEELIAMYGKADCFVFPSRVETWGLPISEFIDVQPEGTLLLADLPYAHETASVGRECRKIYFPACDPVALANEMENLYEDTPAW